MASPPSRGNAGTLLPRHARLIGVDLGTKTIGLALSDVERRIGTPLLTIERKKFTTDAQQCRSPRSRAMRPSRRISSACRSTWDGSEGPRVQATRAFLRTLGPSAAPFAFWDERLSTAAAVNRSLIEQDVSRAKYAAVVDQMAAAYILQGALDRLAAIVASRS